VCDAGICGDGVMKRAEALQPLSRDHLKALLAAKRVVDADSAVAAGAAFSRFWELERDHFRLEEEILLPHWAAHAQVDVAGVQRMLGDHLAIRAGALRLAREALSLDELHALGRRLHDHVRFEERRLFPMIESALDADALAQLGVALAAADAASFHVQDKPA
jgi:hypothetical protein